MSSIKNIAQRKQKVLTHVLAPGEVVEFSADEMKDPRVQYGIATGVIEEVKAPIKQSKVQSKD